MCNPLIAIHLIIYRANQGRWHIALTKRHSAPTLAAWINPTTLGEGGIGRIIAKGSGSGTTSGFRFNTQGTNQLGFAVDYGTTDLFRLSSTNVISLSTWAFVVLTWDGSTNASNIHIYINGSEVTYATTTNAAGSRDNDGASNLYVGNDNVLNRSFKGIIDGARVYDRVLSATEVLNLYETGAP